MRVALTPRPGGGTLLRVPDSFDIRSPHSYFKTEILPRIARDVKEAQMRLVHGHPGGGAPRRASGADPIPPLMLGDSVGGDGGGDGSPNKTPRPLRVRDILDAKEQELAYQQAVAQARRDAN